jgi:MFS family permease
MVLALVLQSQSNLLSLLVSRHAGHVKVFISNCMLDIFFLHDRGKWNTLYWVVYMGSLMIGPIVGGSMALNVGWRNFWWFNVALGAVVLLYTIFLFPETKFVFSISFNTLNRN